MPAIARKSQCDVFISYRRKEGGAQARLIKEELEKHAYEVFLDVTNLDAGPFDERLLQRIAEIPNFLVVLTPHALDRCVDKNDWLRREIGCAIRTNRNIVPILVKDFEPPPELSEEIQRLPKYNGVSYSHEHFDSTLQQIMAKVGEAPKARRTKWRRRISLAAVVFVVAVATYFLMSRNFYNPQNPSQRELALQQDASMLRLGRRFDEAIAKDQAIVDLHGALSSWAAAEIAAMTRVSEQESSLMADGKAAESQNDLTRAKTDYQKVMDLHAARELEAIESFNAVTQKLSGATDADIAKRDFANGVTAFDHGEYAMAKAYFDQILTRAPADWPQRSQAQEFSRRSANRVQQQQHLVSAQNYFNAKNYDAVRNEARQLIGSPDPDQVLVQQVQALVARSPATPATPALPSQPSATSEIQAQMRDAEGLIQQDQFKSAMEKAALVEQLKGDASTLRQAVRTAEETRYQELNSRYLTADKQNASQLQVVLSAFQQFAGNAVNREADSRKYVNQITGEIAALSAPRPIAPTQPAAASPVSAPVANPADVQALLNRYAEAVARGDLAGVKAVRQLSASEEKKMLDSLKFMKGKGFALRNCSMPEIAGDIAKATCDTVLTGIKDAPPGHVVFSLRRINGEWMIVP
jgi:hypothetical protein